MRIPAVLVAVALAACGARVDYGEDPDARDVSSGSPDARPSGSVPDAAVPAGPADAAPDNACGVAATQGDVGILAAAGAVRSQGTAGVNIYSLIAPTPDTAADPAPDALYIELWDDYGAFTGGTARVGTYPLTGDELSYATCGLCVFTLADVDATNGPARLLFATAGTVVVHAVSASQGGALSFEVQGATFQEVDGQNFQPIAGSNCPSPLAHGRLDGAVDQVN